MAQTERSMGHPMAQTVRGLGHNRSSTEVREAQRLRLPPSLLLYAGYGQLSGRRAGHRIGGHAMGRAWTYRRRRARQATQLEADSDDRSGAVDEQARPFGELSPRTQEQLAAEQRRRRRGRPGVSRFDAR